LEVEKLEAIKANVEALEEQVKHVQVPNFVVEPLLLNEELEKLEVIKEKKEQLIDEVQVEHVQEKNSEEVFKILVILLIRLRLVYNL
jgi:hypothetical protein